MTPLLFHKYHGLGNDYLVCHRSVAERLNQEQIRLLCHPHYGIGSDGLLIDSGDAVNPTLRIINPDGSEAEKSGNGLRIYARYLFDSKRVAHQPFLVHTAGGAAGVDRSAGGAELSAAPEGGDVKRFAGVDGQSALRGAGRKTGSGAGASARTAD